MIDDVLALIESLAATSLALTNSLTQAGVNLPISDEEVEFLGITRFRTAQLWMSQVGIDVTSSEESDDAWQFTVRKYPEDVTLLALAISEIVPNHISTIAVHGVGAESVVTIPVSALLHFSSLAESDASPQDLLLCRLEYRKQCDRNGSPLLTASDLIFASAIFGQMLLESNNDAVSPLRRVLNLAKEAGHEDVEALIGRVFATFREAGARQLQSLKSELASLVEESPALDETDVQSVVLELRS